VNPEEKRTKQKNPEKHSFPTAFVLAFFFLKGMRQFIFFATQSCLCD
jgi:hypothetical protein